MNFRKILLILIASLSLSGCNSNDSKIEEKPKEISHYHESEFPCDFKVTAKDPSRGFVIVQISDTQIASGDSTSLQNKVFKFIDPVINEVNPDLIFMAGDNVYGRYDTNGDMQKNLFDHINAYDIPWAPVFGNHDNECPKGIDFQCNLFASYSNCLFKRRSELGGNGNYSIGCCVNDALVKTFYCLDTKGCAQIGNDTSKTSPQSLTEEQVQFVLDSQTKAEIYEEKAVTGFVGVHILPKIITSAVFLKYNHTMTTTGKYPKFTIPTPNDDGDFGTFGETFFSTVDSNADSFYEMLDAHIDGIFGGHNHQNNASVLFEGCRLTFGLKSSTYDFYDADMLGATEIVVKNDSSFKITHHYVSDK